MPPLPGDATAGALGINQLGQVVGFSGGAVVDIRGRISSGSIHPVVWGQDGQPVALPMLGGDATGVARGINNRGQIAGSSGVHGVRWDPSP